VQGEQEVIKVPESPPKIIEEEQDDPPIPQDEYYDKMPSVESFDSPSKGMYIWEKKPDKLEHIWSSSKN
jgi:hypothetical protein